MDHEHSTGLDEARSEPARGLVGSVRGFLRSHGGTFTRASIVGLVSTGAEFVVLAPLAHLSRVPHWIDYGLVQVLGTLITFLLNRYWAFKAQEGHVLFQGVRSMVVFAGSFVLNTALPSIGSYLLQREPVLSFGVSQVVVYLGWNYPMYRYWVFKEGEKK